MKTSNLIIIILLFGLVSFIAFLNNSNDFSTTATFFTKNIVFYLSLTLMGIFLAGDVNFKDKRKILINVILIVLTLGFAIMPYYLMSLATTPIVFQTLFFIIVPFTINSLYNKTI
ncbi:peptidoglycan/LPS O-acetylase OafA/YrhL [Bacilli bacterium PM5-3]|nr:peptidoglycan/LPS O-acetylase OafA/YrhL [Bacilli bacterium PM5-3]